jgi:hypothetical protein
LTRARPIAGSPKTDRRNCLTHPIQAWHAFTAAVTDRADADARAAGLVLFDPLPNGVHRCRDPRLDSNGLGAQSGRILPLVTRVRIL